MLRTIVVRVRAMPGVVLSRESNSSRCCVDRVTTLQKKTLFARDGMDLANFRHLAEATREIVVRAFGGRIATHKGGQVKAQTLGVELSAVAANIAALLEALYPVVYGRSLETDERCELGKGRARIALQCVEQLEIELVELVVDQRHIRHRRRFAERLFGVTTITP